MARSGINDIMDYSFTDADVQPRAASSEDTSEQTVPQTGRTSWPASAVVLIQTTLFLGHWLIFHTLSSFFSLTPAVSQRLAAILFVLSVSFILTSLLAFRFSNALVEILYKISSIWLGILNFLFWAACLCWIADDAVRLAHVNAPAARPWIATGFFGLAVLTSLIGFVNARIIRKRRVTVRLPHLPAAWSGRKALLISDMHLGHVNGTSFARRIANLARRLNPDIIFIAGDLFDGSRIDPDRMAAPLFEMAPPLGVYFAEGNHEHIGDAAAYQRALRRGGIQVLHGEHVEVEGVRIIGIPYADTQYPMHFRAFLDGLSLDHGAPSILLNHVPNRLPIVEKAGVSLQLSGHTHGGQIFPFTWFTRRAFGKYTHGLQTFGNLQVLTSSGVGTWGPPMRVGTAPEVVEITFA